MISFVIAIAVLVIGYYTYGKLVENIFGIDTKRETPAIRLRDDIDFMPLPAWRIFLIQFLNIAGLGPIFGAIAGAMFGPAAFLWIVLGSIFAGAVHDYFSGMLSVRHNGLSISEIVGIYLGPKMKHIMRFFTVILLIFVGTVFLMGPAKIIDGMTGNMWNLWVWVGIILAYYILSTLLPIDKMIGKLYPVFGIAMLLMALGLLIALFFGDYQIPELTPANLRNMTTDPEATPLFPILFVTIACGAISGFHATQSPLMARCMQNERLGRKIFFGTMITEGVVALIWAAAAMTFFGNVGGLNEAMLANGNNAAWAANEISLNMLGHVGGILALLGIVAAPITSGDTAFRSARLILSDIFKNDQKKIKNRLYISVPLFIIAFALTQIDFGIIWRYFAWSNQTLATVVLWTITAYLIYEQKMFWITLIPALFMTMVCTTYILIAPEGFQLDNDLAYMGGGILTLIISLLFWYYAVQRKKVFAQLM
ncbi:carbon starvation CstA family protein [Zobellia galactanivorans]|uniref:carbon starvation CstA family protein n=1 Tax=Zobellia TaxID=112040 RepID=UPI000B536DAE|nr:MULTISPECIES: carbon starvation CstA family protein [Zobellia]MBU3024261.1 carbon starvation protein A [Zobellia galactanivorans]MDO6809664.1 carbon starvation CstA family protein [Zobellia galactanivorans]OWW23310.1 carbon starvation protein A [Zobellia sp. OII3]